MTKDVRPTRFVEHQSWRNILEELKWTRVDCVFCDLLGREKQREDLDSCFLEVFSFSRNKFVSLF